MIAFRNNLALPHVLYFTAQYFMIKTFRVLRNDNPSLFLSICDFGVHHVAYCYKRR